MKKTTLFITLFTFILAIGLSAQNSIIKIEIKSTPTNVEEFIALRNKIATTPEGGASMFAIAMIIYGKNREEGMKCFTAILINSHNMLRDSKSKFSYKNKEPIQAAKYLINMLNDKPYISRSYIVGTSPENRYKLPALPYTIWTNRNKYSVQRNGAIKIYVTSSGADSPRPIALIENNRGLWKVSEFSSLVVDIRKPIIEFDDDI